jgi:NADPH:quinone reductase-like Zn-dependent oxidoreductase
VHILDTAIPEPNDDQVLIKVIVTGTNPKDWKVPEWMGSNINQGDDIAGVVEKVGANVTEFKPGDRVAAFHEMRSPHGSYAEYAIAWAYTTFHIPAKTSFEGTLQSVTVLAAKHKLLDLRLTWNELFRGLQRLHPFPSQP